MNKKVATALVILVVIAAIFAYLNAGDREDRIISQQEAVLILNYQGEEQARVDFDQIQELEEHEFEATLRSSEDEDRDDTYVGVRLHDLLQKFDLPVEEMNQVVTRAVDGYTVALSPEEVLEEDNVYIVYMHNGDYLSPRDEGGSGPYRLVIREDQFAQRWNRYLMEIDVR